MMLCHVLDHFFSGGHYFPSIPMLKPQQKIRQSLNPSLLSSDLFLLFLSLSIGIFGDDTKKKKIKCNNKVHHHFLLCFVLISRRKASYYQLGY